MRLLRLAGSNGGSLTPDDMARTSLATAMGADCLGAMGANAPRKKVQWTYIGIYILKANSSFKKSSFYAVVPGRDFLLTNESSTNFCVTRRDRYII